MAVEAIPLRARGGSANFTSSAFSYCFAVGAPAGGSAECFKNLLKHFLVFN